MYKRQLVIGGKEGLQPVEKTVIDRAVRNVYRPFLAEPDPAKMPILEMCIRDRDCGGGTA